MRGDVHRQAEVAAENIISRWQYACKFDWVIHWSWHENVKWCMQHKSVHACTDSNLHMTICVTSRIAVIAISDLIVCTLAALQGCRSRVFLYARRDESFLSHFDRL